MVSLPGHYIHDITHSYGRLLLPVWWSRKHRLRWLMWSERGYLSLSTAFHNCTVTGVY